MTCDISISGYDGDSASEWHQGFVTARVSHQCQECGAVIPGGEKYERSAGKFEDGWSVWRCCIACAEISNEFSDDGRSFGVLWEELENSWDEGAHLQACLNRLSTATAKEHMRQRWMKWKGLDKVTPPDLPAKP